MSTQREHDTACEVAIRHALWHRGYRYRKHYRVPGTRREIDIALLGPRVAVLVDGCFWHACPEHGTLPVRNREWWQRKLDANVARDRDTDARLRSLGWTVVRLWEHTPADEGVKAITAALRKDRPRTRAANMTPGKR